ncbi:MAG TPA: hypothetical protein VGU90_07225 [Terriglobales bacterium]|jgi:putative exporter of polyketide antibiotics|nr:hypothetical protein [Terriglobales bacterium]
MANLSTARKLGVAARIAGKQVQQSRTYSAVLSGARAALGHFGGVLRQLWHEITGFVFLAFAGVGLVALVRQYSAYHAHKDTSGHLALAAGFTVMFGWFGITSFLRARNRR